MNSSSTMADASMYSLDANTRELLVESAPLMEEWSTTHCAGKESVAEPETLARPAEIAAFLGKRLFDGLDREVMSAVYVDPCHRVIGWTVAYVGSRALRLRRTCVLGR